MSVEPNREIVNLPVLEDDKPVKRSWKSHLWSCEFDRILSMSEWG